MFKKKTEQKPQEFIQFSPKMKSSIDQNLGQHIGWIKNATYVDKTKTDHNAIEGRFLNAGVETELPVGAIILYSSLEKSDDSKNSQTIVNIYRIKSDGTEEQINENKMDWKQEFSNIRDLTADALLTSFPSDKKRVIKKSSKKSSDES